MRTQSANGRGHPLAIFELKSNSGHFEKLKEQLIKYACDFGDHSIFTRMYLVGAVGFEWKIWIYELNGRGDIAKLVDEGSNILSHKGYEAFQKLFENVKDILIKFRRPSV